tara:strand:- start:306 stop:554 length:249 start_codon:yes stop_codon:yes gene_type:complete
MLIKQPKRILVITLCRQKDLQNWPTNSSMKTDMNFGVSIAMHMLWNLQNIVEDARDVQLNLIIIVLGLTIVLVTETIVISFI